MKKITKTFYVSDCDLDRLRKGGKNLSLNFYDSTLYQVVPPHSVEITFSVPEKTVTISEGDFDSIVLGPWREFLVHNETHRTMVNQMKQKLFGESHD